MKTQLQVEIRGIVVFSSHRDVREGHPYQTTQSRCLVDAFAGWQIRGFQGNSTKN
jgi:hypothetical protein